jgi:hypothetical protein
MLLRKAAVYAVVVSSMSTSQTVIIDKMKMQSSSAIPRALGRRRAHALVRSRRFVDGMRVVIWLLRSLIARYHDRTQAVVDTVRVTPAPCDSVTCTVHLIIWMLATVVVAVTPSG